MNFLGLFFRFLLASVLLAPVGFLVRRAPAAVKHAILCVAVLLGTFGPLAAFTRVSPQFYFEPTVVPRPLKTLMSQEPPSWLKSAPPKVEEPAFVTKKRPEVPTEPKGILLILWTAPIIVGLVWFLFGYGGAIRILRRSQDQGDYFSSEDVTVPMTFWFKRSVILLPAEAKTWTAAQREAAIRHEQAHIRRGDWFTLTLAYAFTLLQWWNPLAWFTLRQLRNATEEAADELAIRAYPQPAEYAQSFLEVLKIIKLKPGLTLTAVVPMAKSTRAKTIKKRFQTMLNPRRWSTIKTTFVALLPTLLVWPALTSLAALPTQVQPQKGSGDEIVTDVANRSNNWTVTSSKGRKIKLAYVAMQVRNQTVAWTPDGNLIGDASKLPIQAPKPVDKNERMYVYEWEDPTGIGEAGAGSGLSTLGGLKSSLFGRGDFTTKLGQPGVRYTGSFVAYPEGFVDRAGEEVQLTTAGFYLSAYKLNLRWQWARQSNAKGFGVAPNPDDFQSLPALDTKGPHFGPAGTSASLEMRFSSALGGNRNPHEQGVYECDVVILKRVDLNGKITTDAMYLDTKKGVSVHRVPLPKGLAGYKSLEIYTGKPVTAQFTEIRMNPNGPLQK